MLEMEHSVPETIELDIKDYPILIRPGLYEFFLANRKLGLEALHITKISNLNLRHPHPYLLQIRLGCLNVLIAEKK